ncbi:MAG: 2-oxo acid dehydrogenase subunit E2, partial [Spirochaetaceae bacterium]
MLLPKQGNSVESCIITSWKVAPGDAVKTGDPIVEVETDKTTMEVESTADGVLLRQLAAEGDEVPVLSPIALIGEPGEAVADAPPREEPSAGTEPRVDATQNAPAEAAKTPRARRRGGARISPRARKLADSLNVDTAGLSGSGPGGRIMARDVQDAADSGAVREASSAPAIASSSGRATTEPRGTGPAHVASEQRVSGVRKLIASRMQQSLASTAQLTMDASADARGLLAYRAKLKSARSESLQKISINDLVLFATSRAVADFDEVNATFADGTITRYSGVDLGFAVDTPKGLMVPVIRGADSLSLVQIAEAAHTLAERCVAGTIDADSLSGGTFTVTNLGAFGIERFTPVLNAPQVAILGVCSITHRQAPDGSGTIPMIGLSLTVDHQVVDG